MSVFICIMKGDYDSLLAWPFNHRLTFTMLDQSDNVQARNHLTYVIKPNICKENRPFVGRPTTERNASFGAQKFADLEIITSSKGYIVDDTVYIKVEIDNENMILP
jgi:TNF receptor-associated factor 4